MSTVNLATAPPEVHYPESDGKPMAETDWQLWNMLWSIPLLKRRFARNPLRYVGGDMFIYFEEGVPKSVVAPDVFTVPGAGKHFRRVWKTWVEGVGPDAILEFTSRSTQSVDEGKKFIIYRDRLKVYEYFLFDPETGKNLPFLDEELDSAEAARRTEEAARRQEEVARRQAEKRADRAEQELERLRAEMERVRGNGDDADPEA